MAKPEDQITTNFFGINPKTYEVESISLTRGGALSRVGDGSKYWNAKVPDAAAAKQEIAHRLGLVEIVEASVQSTGEQQLRKIMEDLETKAEIMKQENSE
ncbi:hypothetical protein [Bradyrhizobium sp.]|uniref:hypothetical protein n=1 Tax=Bradyrhizobium sp. TaxID=376 RepID=UPI001D3C868E|nr:hypothetical protein [Bradyrhizobium sp.]MBI5322527.1 hypothetical protein [Bradyrhizobium sp.]